MENLSTSGKVKFVLLATSFIVIASIASYFVVQKTREKKLAVSTVNKAIDVSQQSDVDTFSFATYQEVPVNIQPKITPYTVSGGLSNVSNKDDFELDDKVKNMLIKNGFAVKPAWNKEFFSLYESNRYSYIPNFVTTDSILHNYHLYFDYLLRRIEEEKFIPLLKKLNIDTLKISEEYFNQLKGTPWENAAKRNIGFFAVGGSLMDPNFSVPDPVKKEVKEELTLINAHQGIAGSPLWNMGEISDISLNSPQGTLPLAGLKEDYSQYIPRGHYTKSDGLKSYFKSMMWYGRITFRFKNDDEIKSAILITLMLFDNKDIRKQWEDLNQTINFMVGASDDITYYQMKDVMDKVYGKIPTLKELQDQNKFQLYKDELSKLTSPQINSIPIFNPAIQPDREEEIKGFRYFGQRYTPDAAIFQRLVCREVGNKHGTMDCPTPDSRMLPKGLDIPSAMGSNEAYNILKNMGETEYKNYPENMAKLKDYFSNLEQKNWTQNLYWGWLYSLLPLTIEKPEGYPSFMRNLAWIRKDLVTYLGSWTELKHDTILYAKQVYAELGGMMPEKKDDRGYVEPNPQVYARLASLLRMTKDGLSSRRLLGETSKNNLEKLEKLTLSLKAISEKELTNTPLDDEEYELIRSYGGQLEHFWLEVNKEEMETKGIDKMHYLDQNPAALIADVATDPNGRVLEEGIGNIFEIYAVVPVEGKLKIVKGGVFSYYEFPWDLSDRLTDEKWREMVDNNKTPELPSWTRMFITD